MVQNAITSGFSTVVALDQHARSVSMCALDLATGESRSGRLGRCPGAGDIAAWAEPWATPPVLFAYESGPCGFSLCRDLRALGHGCVVIAVSSIPRSARDRAFKDDRNDAASLLDALAAPETRCRVVWLPSEGQEAAKDLVRALDDAVDACRRSKQRLSSFLLRHGHVWDERTRSGALRATWTRAYVEWARRAALADPTEERVRDAYLAHALEDVERCKRLRRDVSELAQSPEFKPVVDAMTRLKGVDDAVALAFAATVGDFERFGSGRRVAAYFGLTSGRADSGPKVSSGRRISKSGDAAVRWAVVEGLTSIANYAATPKAARRGREVSEAIEAEARKCNDRIRERYGHLAGESGKHPNVAKTAAARELVQFMWVLGRMAQRESQGS